MSRYDLRFSIGLDSESKKTFETQLNELTKKRKVEIGLNTREINLFKKTLTQGFDTTVRFHADIDELKRAVSQFNIRDITEPFTPDSFISQQTLDLSEKRIQKLVTLQKKLNEQKEKVIKASNEVVAQSGRRYLGDYNSETKNYSPSKEAFEKSKSDSNALRTARYALKTEAEEYQKVYNKTLSTILALEADPKMKDALKKLVPSLRSSEGFMKLYGKSGKTTVEGYRESISDIISSVALADNEISYEPLNKLSAYLNEFKALRGEIRNFVKDNNVSINSKGTIKGLSELGLDKLTEVNEIILRMRELNKLIESIGGNKQTLGAHGNKAENQLFNALRSELENRIENTQRAIAVLDTKSEKARTSVTSQAASELYEDLSNGLNGIPINSFAISQEAIESVREQVQAQLSNITIGKTITLTPNSDGETQSERVVLPSVVIGSFELSAEAITKLRADTQEALNNVTLEPSADEASFTEAFEKVAKTYQNKLNTLGRKLNRAIEKPVIEEFDATPAIEKMKAQINETLKSFKFDINGRVAHGTISTGLDEEYQYAFKTYESLESAVGKMTSGANSKIEKLTKMGSTAGSSDVLVQYNELISKINTFKEAFREIDGEGKLVMSLEDANKQMANLLSQSHKLEDSFNNVATKNSIEKTLDNTASGIRAMASELDKYQETDAVKNVKIGLVGEDGISGILKEVETLKASMPNKSISEANTEMMELLTKVEKLRQELEVVGANTPLNRELERAGSEAERAQRAVLNLQEKMQKALTANSRGFSMPEYRSRYNEIYSALTSGNLGTNEVRALGDSFKSLMNDMRDAGVTGKSFGDIMRGMYAKFGSWTMVTMTIQRVIMTFKRMVSAVQEVDSALTNLRKVTNATEADLDRFMRSVGDSAHKLGASMSDLVNATAEFSRLGYDLNQSQKLGELATMYKSVAEDLDITTASQSIVSTLKAFEKAGISAERIVDVFNYVGNNFAISSAGIGEAMQRSAASLQTANNSLEQSVALITAANTVAQDPIKVGTAMKTLSARIRGSKTELTELGEDMDFLAEGTSKLRNEIMSLSGVDIMVDENNFKSTYQIIDELSTAYQGMVETSQARLAELLGGKNQANIVSALLENFDVARKTLRDSTANADGSAEKELETALESINGRINQLSATWQKFSTDVLESDGFKVIISGADKLLKILDDLIGGSNTLIKLAPMVLAGFGIAKGKSGLGEPEKQRVLIICPEFMSRMNNRLYAV